MGFMLAGIGICMLLVLVCCFSAFKNMTLRREDQESKSSEECGNGSCRRRRTEERGCIRQNRSMSIAERANMVKNLEDEEEDGENEKE